MKLRTMPMSPGMARLMKGVPQGLMTKRIKLPDGSMFEWKQRFLTLAEREQARVESGEDNQMFAIRLIVDKAVEPDGVTKSFDEADVPMLRTQVPASMADDIITELVKTTFDGVQTPSSKSGSGGAEKAS